MISKLQTNLQATMKSRLPTVLSNRVGFAGEEPYLLMDILKELPSQTWHQVVEAMDIDYHPTVFKVGEFKKSVCMEKFFKIFHPGL